MHAGSREASRSVAAISHRKLPLNPLFKINLPASRLQTPLRRQVFNLSCGIGDVHPLRVLVLAQQVVMVWKSREPSDPKILKELVQQDRSLFVLYSNAATNTYPTALVQTPFVRRSEIRGHFTRAGKLVAVMASECKYTNTQNAYLVPVDSS